MGDLQQDQSSAAAEVEGGCSESFLGGVGEEVIPDLEFALEGCVEVEWGEDVGGDQSQRRVDAVGGVGGDVVCGDLRR